MPPHDSRKTELRNANFPKCERRACLHEKKVTIFPGKKHTTSHKRTWPQIVHPVKRQLKGTPVLNKTSPDANCSQHQVLLVELCNENVHDLVTHLFRFSVLQYQTLRQCLHHSWNGQLYNVLVDPLLHAFSGDKRNDHDFFRKLRHSKICSSIHCTGVEQTSSPRQFFFFSINLKCVHNLPDCSLLHPFKKEPL